MTKNQAVGFCGPGFHAQGGKCYRASSCREARGRRHMAAPRGRSGMRKKAVTRTTERLSGIQMRIVALLLLAFALGAASPAPQADSDPVSLIEAVYASYEKGEPELSDLYSRRLQALIDKDEKETPEGMVGRIDWDVFVDGQDWKLSDLKITPVSQTATQADIRATFTSFGDPRDILISLVLEDGHWRIDEVQETLKPRWTMSKILLDAPDAFPDAPPDKAPDGN